MQEKQEKVIYITNGNKKPNSFGGYIYQSDYEGGRYSSMCDIASRIISDMKFDQKCCRKY